MMLDPEDLAKGLIGHITLGVETTVDEKGFSSLNLVNGAL